ncbi:MAG TPA: SDR family NAD(P)-dependent oxidoreductase [Saprospiraceae bacterium]|nr:SDR family NAD(P)-dependent oxidoreductase [Saprospiraceae bacterium]HMQ82798.1 SDR family NAD(P)-dependent oxidoreductase [Saprospiraceae bacterium]
MKLSNSEKVRLQQNYGPWALVTGASSGIGLVLAERLAEAGLNVVLSARRKELLEKISADIQHKYGVKTRVVAADLSLAKDIHQLLEATRDLDIGLLVPCAGYGTSGEFIQSDLPTEINMLRLNCEAVLILTHHFVQVFKQRKRSGIILMSSLVAFQGVPYAGHYAATKAYIQSLSEALAIELRPYNIAVLAPTPGPVESGFGERANMKMNLSQQAADLGIPILKALGRQSIVVPGGISKLLVYSLRTVPRWAKVRILKLVMGGMTQHQRQTRL